MFNFGGELKFYQSILRVDMYSRVLNINAIYAQMGIYLC